MSDQGTVGVSKKEKVKQYLESSILPFLSQALTKLCAEEPEDPFEWLGRYLLENNPHATRKFDHKEALVLKLAQGDFFGEIALLHGKPRQATVKAVGSTTLLVLSRDAFNRLCGSLFDILQRNIGEYKDVEFVEERPEESLDDFGGLSEEEDYEEPPPPPVNMRRGRRDTVYMAATKANLLELQLVLNRICWLRLKMTGNLRNSQKQMKSVIVYTNTLRRQLCCHTLIHPQKTWW